MGHGMSLTPILSQAPTRAYAGNSPELQPSPHGLRMPALDGFRGWAVLAVILYHFSRPMLAEPSHGRAWWAALHLMLAGGYGVDMFFALSGFLISGILLASKADPHYFRNFYMRRVLRIFPLYYGVLIVCFGLLWWTTAIKPFVPHSGWMWLYVTNFAGLKGVSFEPTFDHFWSLAVEEQFYLVWPLVVYLLSTRSLVKLSIALAVVSLLLRCGLISTGVLEPNLAAELTPCRLEGLVLGSLLAVLARQPGGLAGIRHHAIWIGAVAGIAALVSKFVVRSSGGIWGDLGIGHLTVPLAFTCMLALAAEGRGLWARLLSVRWLRFFGKYSYGLYVFHYLFEPWLDARFWYLPSIPLASLLLHMACAVSVVVVIALASWHCYERLFLKLKMRFEDKKSSTGPMLINAEATIGPRGHPPRRPASLSRNYLPPAA